MPQRARLLNSAFDTVTAQQAVDQVFDCLNAGIRGWVCTVNVTTLMHMRKNSELQSFADSALLIVADGQPLVWAAPLFEAELPERVAGIDLLDLLCQRAAEEEKVVYLLGAQAHVVRRAVENLKRRHQRLRVEGSDGFFSPAEAGLRAEAVRASGAHILFVGMGSPRQEQFIRTHWDRLGVGIAVGVGGTFDVLAGVRVRAPRWIQHAGMEWLVRLLQEPKRLLPRYFKANSAFCFLMVRQTVLRFTTKILAKR